MNKLTIARCTICTDPRRNAIEAALVLIGGRWQVNANLSRSPQSGRRQNAP